MWLCCAWLTVAVQVRESAKACIGPHPHTGSAFLQDQQISLQLLIGMKLVRKFQL